MGPTLESSFLGPCKRGLVRVFLCPSPDLTGKLKQVAERDLFSGESGSQAETPKADRAAGQTKWNYFNLFGLAFEGITSFSIAPLRAMVLLGLITAILGGIFGAWIVFKTLFFGNDLDGYPSIIAMITFLGGVQLLSIGVLGEYVGKTYFEAKQRPLFIIQEVVQQSLQPARNHSSEAAQGTPVNVTTD